MKPTDLRRLSAAGLTTEQIAVVMEIMDEDAEARRASGRARWRKHQEKKRNANVSQHEQTLAANSRAGVTRVEDKPLSQKLEKEGKKEAARAVRLPEGWILPDDMRAEAIAMGLPPERCDAEAATMLDWSRSAPAGAKRDWRAAWRNWVRRALEKMQARAGPVNGTPSLAKVFGMVREKAAEIEQRRDGGGGAGAVIFDLPAIRAQ